MTIPQLENEIRIAHEQIAELRNELNRMTENVNELRNQIGIERAPICAPTMPADYDRLSKPGLNTGSVFGNR